MYLRGDTEVEHYCGGGWDPVTCYSRTNNISTDSAPGWSDCFSSRLRRICNKRFVRTAQSR